MNKILRPKYRLPLTEEEAAEIKQFWADFNALGNNINKLDPNDPIWAKPDEDEHEDTYESTNDGD